MCGGGKKSKPAPAPTYPVVNPNQNNQADYSNGAQQRSAVLTQTNQMPGSPSTSFGSELAS